MTFHSNCRPDFGPSPITSPAATAGTPALVTTRATTLHPRLPGGARQGLRPPHAIPRNILLPSHRSSLAHRRGYASEHWRLISAHPRDPTEAGSSRIMGAETSRRARLTFRLHRTALAQPNMLVGCAPRRRPACLHPSRGLASAQGPCSRPVGGQSAPWRVARRPAPATAPSPFDPSLEVGGLQR